MLLCSYFPIKYKREQIVRLVKNSKGLQGGIQHGSEDMILSSVWCGSFKVTNFGNAAGVVLNQAKVNPQWCWNGVSMVQKEDEDVGVFAADNKLLAGVILSSFVVYVEDWPRVSFFMNTTQAVNYCLHNRIIRNMVSVTCFTSSEVEHATSEDVHIFIRRPFINEELHQCCLEWGREQCCVEVNRPLLVRPCDWVVGMKISTCWPLECFDWRSTCLCVTYDVDFLCQFASML